MNTCRGTIFRATTRYNHILHSIPQFGNLREPNRATHENGGNLCEMVSLIDGDQVPDPVLRILPSEFKDRGAGII